MTAAEVFHTTHDEVSQDNRIPLTPARTFKSHKLPRKSFNNVKASYVVIA